jgi:glycerol kinase
MQSHLAGVPIARPRSIETTAWGVAAMAGLTTGVFEDLKALTALAETATLFSPTGEKRAAEEKRATWKKAMDAAILFAKK